MFVLRYDLFDEFVGRYILPLVIEVINVEEYSNYEYMWKCSENHIVIDIIGEIIMECENSTIDYTKLAFLKELGRTSYIRKDKILKMRSIEEIDNSINYMKEDENLNILRAFFNNDSELVMENCP